MSLNPKTAALVRNGALDFLTSHIGASPVMRWYDGTQPTDADTALGSQVLLATLPGSSALAAAASAGSMACNAFTSAAAVAAGTVTWGSLLTSGFVRKLDFSIGTATSNLIVNSATIGSGATCACSSFTISMAA